MLPAPSAPPDSAARIVSSGSFDRHLGAGDMQTVSYEVWTDSVARPWMIVHFGTDASPVRLDQLTVFTLEQALAAHSSAEITRETIGVGVADGTLSLDLNQQWPLLSVVALLAVFAVTVVLVLSAVRARRRARTARAVARHETDSREAERERISREIHDGPLQDLALLARDGGLEGGDRDERQRLLQAVGADLRALAANLRPPALDHLGLAAALADLSDRWARAPLPLDVRVQVDAAVPRSAAVDLTLYRVAQEALTNASVHGRADAAWVFVQTSNTAPGGTTDLVVRDDGDGIAFTFSGREAALVAQGHFGLAGMAERARAVGGTIRVGPGPGGGAEVRLSVPRGASPGTSPSRERVPAVSP